MLRFQLVTDSNKKYTPLKAIIANTRTERITANGPVFSKLPFSKKYEINGSDKKTNIPPNQNRTLSNLIVEVLTNSSLELNSFLGLYTIITTPELACY